MVQAKRVFVVLLGAIAVATTQAQNVTTPEPAARIDNGLGALPHYSEWREPWVYAMPAEDIDSGLGDMPNVSRMVEVWLYSYPAEKIDSGLGELARTSDRTQDLNAVALDRR